ncbi:hypothetical protein OSTOST_25618, partial [Ostertagia ostertagi]
YPFLNSEGTFRDCIGEDYRVRNKNGCFDWFILIKKNVKPLISFVRHLLQHVPVLQSDRRISTVHEGDWILYPQCGAYSTCLSTHFNGFYPPNILYLISASNWSTVANAMRGNEVISERIPSKM